MVKSEIKEMVSKLMGTELPFDQFDRVCSANSQEINKEDSVFFDSIRRVFSIQYYLAMRFGKVLKAGLTYKENYYQLIWTAFQKIMISLYSAISLTANGMVGSARILMRHVFEFLVIGKFASISADENFIKRWETGENIQMQRDIFNKITYPGMQDIKETWKLLCKYTHGTIYSQQIKFKWEDIKDDIFLNIILISTLLEMNNHFLNTHIMDSNLTYYIRRYAEDYNIIKILKSKIKEDLKVIKPYYKDQIKKTIYYYKFNWSIKEENK